MLLETKPRITAGGRLHVEGLTLGAGSAGTDPLPTPREVPLVAIRQAIPLCALSRHNRCLHPRCARERCECTTGTVNPQPCSMEGGHENSPILETLAPGRFYPAWCRKEVQEANISAAQSTLFLFPCTREPSRMNSGRRTTVLTS